MYTSIREVFAERERGIIVMSWQQLRYDITSWEYPSERVKLIRGPFKLVKLACKPVPAD